MTTTVQRLVRRSGVLRAPLVLFDRGLGPVMGGRFMDLEHTGRSTGLPRRAVLEVVDRPDDDTYLVIAGSPTSQWLSNVRADPRVRITCGRRTRQPATAEVLCEVEAGRALVDWARRRPLGWALTVPFLVLRERDRATGGAPALTDLVRLVRLTLHTPPSSPAQTPPQEDR